MKETVGAVIKAARTEGMELARVAFAARVAVTAQTVYYWEVGKRRPHYDHFVRLLTVVPPHFALRLLAAAGMSNPEAWVIRLYNNGAVAANPTHIFLSGGNNKQ